MKNNKNPLLQKPASSMRPTKLQRSIALLTGTIVLGLAGYGNAWAVQANCSLNTGVPATVNFTNTINSIVDIIWVDPQCVEHVITQLAPGSSVSQSTYKNDVWLSRKADDHTLVTRTQQFRVYQN